MIRINLLPVREARRQARQLRQGVYLASAAGVGVLLCLVLHVWMTSHIRSHRTQLVAKEQELKRLEETQKQVKQFEAEKADIEAKLGVIQEIEGLKLSTFKLKGEYPYPKLGELGRPAKAGKDAKKAKAQKKAGVAHGDG